MPTIFWILLWVGAIGTIAYFTVREVRSGRRGPGDFDRTQHEAAREAGIRSDIRGPGTFDGF